MSTYTVQEFRNVHSTIQSKRFSTQSTFISCHVRENEQWRTAGTRIYGVGAWLNGPATPDSQPHWARQHQYGSMVAWRDRYGCRVGCRYGIFGRINFDPSRTKVNNRAARSPIASSFWRLRGKTPSTNGTKAHGPDSTGRARADDAGGANLIENCGGVDIICRTAARIKKFEKCTRPSQITAKLLSHVVDPLGPPVTNFGPAGATPRGPHVLRTAVEKLCGSGIAGK